MTQRGSSGGGGPGSGSGNRSELTADQAGSGPEQGAAGDGARGDGGTGEDGAGNGPGQGEGEGESSAPTPEHLREASNLILKNLQERLERGDVDEELLREFGWKDLGAMEKFVSKLEEQLEAANDDSPEARARQREFEELLKNLALSGETRKRGTGQGGARRVEQVEARRRPVPSELRQRFDAFTRGLSQSGAGAKPATGANANPAAKPPGSQPKSTTPAPRK